MKQEGNRRGAARGDTRTSDGTPPRLLRFAWTDPETGDRLSVELLSSDAFHEWLVAAGFEPLEDARVSREPRGSRGRTGEMRARSSAGDRAGSAPSGDAA